MAAFAFVGLSATVQSWFFVIDGGNLAARMVASGRSSVRGGGAARISMLFGAGEWFYLSVLLFSALAVGVWAALAWLGTGEVADSDLTEYHILVAAVLIVLAGAVKLLASYYRGTLIGNGNLATVNGISLSCYFLRFPLPWAISLLHPDIRLFLAVQLSSFVCEAGLLKLFCIRQGLREYVAVSTRELAGVLSKEGVGVGLVFGLALLMQFAGQADRAILASVLSLHDYGVVSLAILLCAGVHVLSTAIAQVRLPSLAREGSREDGTFRRMFAELLCLAGLSAAMIFAAATPLAQLVGPDESSARELLAYAFRYYSIGNALLLLSGGLYIYFMARGELRSYRSALVAYVLVYVPCLLLAARVWGLDGAGVAWIVGNLVLILLLLRNLRRSAPGSFRIASRLVSVAVPATVFAAAAGTVLQVGLDARQIPVSWQLVPLGVLCMGVLLAATRLVQFR